MTYFTGSAANKAFHTLMVDELTTNGTAYAMRTDLKNADKLVVNKSCQVRTIFCWLIF